jgi:hypothetical protein
MFGGRFFGVAGRRLLDHKAMRLPQKKRAGHARGRTIYKMPACPNAFRSRINGKLAGQPCAKKMRLDTNAKTGPKSRIVAGAAGWLGRCSIQRCSIPRGKRAARWRYRCDSCFLLLLCGLIRRSPIDRKAGKD